MKARFTLRNGLLAVIPTATWLASSQLSPAIQSDLWSFVRLLVLTVPVLSAVYHRGERRAFWVGAAIVVLSRYVPIGWPLREVNPSHWNVFEPFLKTVQDNDRLSIFFSNSVELLMTAMFCALHGLVVAAIYRFANRSREGHG